MRFVRQSCVNFNNLISRITQHSRVSVNRSQSSLKLLSFNSQSCRQIATDIYDLIVDNSIDVLMLTETWLYSNGDEAYTAAMTPQVTSSVRSLVLDLEKVASAQLFKILFKNFIVCVCV